MNSKAPRYMRVRNARAAISHVEYRSATAILIRQERPGLSYPDLRALLDRLIFSNEIDFKMRGKIKTYRWARELAEEVTPAYNVFVRNEFSPPSTEVDIFLSTLYRLKQGKAVHLSMDDPKLKHLRHYTGNGKRLVSLVPGELIGLAQGIVLVSIIGLGSSLIRPGETGQKVANLVLAGMPAVLATQLMNKLHQVFKE